ncbi:MAG: hypothetical protein GOV00_01870 [Candidatus Altiarchaeota archaeon]|nr:hypothetical protein [Candidatus Altiarchaeota archaeon]
MVPRKDILLVILLSVFGITSAFFSQLVYLDSHFIFALEGLFLSLFVTGTVFLRSLRRGFIITFVALLTVIFTALLHVILFQKYDTVAPIAYFVVASVSFFINLFIAYRHYTSKKPLYQVYELYKPSLAAVFVTFMSVSFILSFQDILYQFGLLTLMGIALSYLTFLFIFAPLIRIDKWLNRTEELTEKESRTHTFVKKYGKTREVYPFFASWLGTAVTDVENFIDSLEAKGYMGHNFFSFQNLFYWFLTFIAFAMGLTAAERGLGGYFLPFLLFVTGIALMGPQTFFQRRFRRVLGVLIVLASLVYFHLSDIFVFRFAAASAILATVSIYFAYRDEETISILFASFFVGALYILGRSTRLPFFLQSPIPWVITLVTMMMLLHHLYVKEQLF